MTNHVPKTKLKRATIAGVAAAKVGLGELGHRAKRRFMSDENSKTEKDLLDEKNAKILFGALTQLRGTALKLAQMLGMELDFLPASYQKELKKSFHQVPPLNRVLVGKVMKQEFGHGPDKMFKSFQPDAFAAASLGQVHKAKLENGTRVAVKIQYPGIGVAIESDLTLMRTVVRGMQNSKIMLQSLTEVGARLKEEVDYTVEAENTRWFAKRVKMEGITIPKVFEQHSSTQVLTTGLASGKHLDDWLATNPSQKLRNKVAQRLYNFFMHCLSDLRCLHADPNPGNYLFNDDGTIAVIDFGCVRHLSEKFTTIMPQIFDAYMRDNADDLFDAYTRLGMSHPDFGPKMYEDLFRPFGQWLTMPFQTKRFDFGKHKNYTRLGMEPMRRFSENLSNPDYVAEEFIFHNRTIYGLFQIFERMEAKVKLRHHWELS